MVVGKQPHILLYFTRNDQNYGMGVISTPIRLHIPGIVAIFATIYNITTRRYINDGRQDDTGAAASLHEPHTRSRHQARTGGAALAVASGIPLQAVCQIAARPP